MKKTRNSHRKQELVFKDEIKETVYLTRSYESQLDQEETLFKHNSKLVLDFDRLLEPFLNKQKRVQVNKWSQSDVAKFIDSIPECRGTGELFAREEIDGEALLLIQLTDLVRLLDLKLGKAVKIYNYVFMLKRRSHSS